MSIVTAWRDASRVIAEAQALACLPCTGRPGPCTCARARPCRCGHPGALHEHYHPRTYCGMRGCPCPRYRRPFKIIFWRHR